jgi:hypothetical protein
MECREKMGSKFLADAGLPYANSSTIAAMLRDRIKYTPSIQNRTFRGSTAEIKSKRKQRAIHCGSQMGYY